MYAMVCTRTDLAFITGMLRRYLSNPGIDHRKAVKRVMRYLLKTQNLMLVYRRSNQPEITGYCDSDYVGCLDSRRSTFGYVFLFSEGTISWRSAKQGLVASSTMEAEYIACYESSNQAIWQRNFVTGLHLVPGVERPFKVYCDNNSIVLYANNNWSSTKSKYIDIKYRVARERIQSGIILVEHIGRNSMIADPLTKGVPLKLFREHVAHMGPDDILFWWELFVPNKYLAHFQFNVYLVHALRFQYYLVQY